MKFVDLDTARNARGLRLVVLAGMASPWCEAAKAIFHVKGLDFVALRLTPADDDLRRWTASRNTPIVLYDDEPPRSGWAEILALAERLEPRVRLLPDDVAIRARINGFSHEILGENGLLWCSRLLMIDASLASDGANGFPLPVARYLATRYGHATDRIAGARRRIFEALCALDELLADGRRGGGPYYLGDSLGALDIYSAAAMGFLAPLPDERGAGDPAVRAGLTWLHRAIGARLPAALIEHRDFVYSRHFEEPLAL